MHELYRQFRDFFVSLKLTVVLLALAIILIFAATLDQVHLGIWAVQEKYFRTFFVLWKVGEVPIPVFPGGYFIGGLLLINLVAAHLYRFKFAWSKTGIQLTHSGLILLLVGEGLSGIWQEEYQMRLEEGEKKNYSESARLNELAITNTTDPNFDDVVAIPEALLARGEPIQQPQLPFQIVPKIYFPNSELKDRPNVPNAPPSPANVGAGPMLVATPFPMTYQTDERNIPTAFVELIGAQGSLGTFLVSPDLVAPQHFDYAGKTWKIAMRFQRSYRPFSLTLEKFTHDIYPGTDIPKNFSSRVHITSPDGRDDRDVLIYMNNPLRFAGLTFFQASFDEKNEHVTILQVVRNPSWRLPYIACLMMGLGLVIQFGLHLFRFIGKRRALSPVPA